MNKSETELFARADWWDTAGAFRLLHDINPARLAWLRQTAGDLSGKRLFDLGCGGGIFAEAAAAAGAKVTGADASAAAVAAAKAHAKNKKLALRYRHADGIAGEKPGQYDVVTCFEMLEHAPSPAAVVADVAALLAPGGIAAFSTINRTFRAWALMIAGLETALKILPAGAHDYRRFITPTELAAMCRRCGLAVTAVTGLRYSFFGRVYLPDERDTAVNYFLAAKRADD